MDPDIIGYAGGALIAVSLLPQVYKSWKSKSTEDISLVWTIIYASGICLYLAFAWMTDIMPFLVFGTIELFLALSLLYLKLRHG
jgi:MtN3 and saliva related transmembrane protein